jgi:hypothetical protein
VKVAKMSISMDTALADDVRTAARQEGRGLSSWISEAVAARLRSEALAGFLDDWEAERGPLTIREISRAEAELRVRREPRS